MNGFGIAIAAVSAAAFAGGWILRKPAETLATQGAENVVIGKLEPDLFPGPHPGITVADLEALPFDAVLNLLREHADEPLGEAAIKRLAKLDPERSTDEAAGLSSLYRERLFTASFRELAMRESADQLAKRVSELTRPDLVRLAVTNIVASLAGSDPRKALQFVERYPLPITLNDEMLRGLFSEWARSEPGGAGEIAIGLTQLRQRKAAVLGVAETWGRTDPKAALAWVEGVDDP